MRDETKLADRIESTGEVAEALGISVQHLTRLKNGGHVTQVSNGKFRVGDAMRGYAASLKQKRRPAAKSEHSRLARAQAVKVETENLRRLGELLPADMVHETLQVIAAAIVSQRPGQAGRLANDLASITDPGVIREKILDDWRLILADVERVFKARAQALEATEDRIDDSDSASEADAESMGGRKPDIPAGQRRAGAVPFESNAVLHTDPTGGGGSALSASGRGDGNADG